MRLISNNEENSLISKYRDLVEPHLKDLDDSISSQRKKIIEICHIGKFLIHLDNYCIERVQERPDTIIKNGSELIGLEHEVILDQSFKNIEGYFENLARQVENLFLKSEYSNFQANIHFNTSYPIKTKEKSMHSKLIFNMVHSCLDCSDYQLHGFMTENYFDYEDVGIINKITLMKHSLISVNSNCGAWWQKQLKADILKKSIKLKEAKLPTYLESGISKQWLLLVIGSLNGSSYEIDQTFEVNVNSGFDKIFLLEDFRNNLYEIK